QISEKLKTSLAAAHRVLLNKYYVDELYGALFVRGVALGGGNALWANDRYVIDGGDGQVRPGLGVNGVGWMARDIVARLSNFFDLGGLSTLLILLTTLLGAISILCSWSAITVRVKQYYVFLLLLQLGMLGVICALDMFLFYVFWEVMLVPMYFLICIWGGDNR